MLLVFLAWILVSIVMVGMCMGTVRLVLVIQLFLAIALWISCIQATDLWIFYFRLVNILFSSCRSVDLLISVLHLNSTLVC